MNLSDLHFLFIWEISRKLQGESINVCVWGGGSGVTVKFVRRRWTKFSKMMLFWQELTFVIFCACFTFKNKTSNLIYEAIQKAIITGIKLNKIDIKTPTFWGNFKFADVCVFMDNL